MTAPDPAPTASSPGQPTLANIIDIRDWLSRQGGTIPQTPAHLVTWLHERIATAAADPGLVRLARLSHLEDHRRQFGALLTHAFDTGQAAAQLAGVELFDRYAHDHQFHADLVAIAGAAAFLAVRVDHTLPIDQHLAQAVIPPGRQRQLVKAIHDHAPRYHAAGLSPARYIAEAHVPGAASSTEWDWIAYYIAAHPDLLTGPVMSPQEIQTRDRTQAERLARLAYQAFTDGDYKRALEFIDDAELAHPSQDWPPIRDHIRHHMAAPEPAAPPPPGRPPVEAPPSALPPPTPAAATAFPATPPPTSQKAPAPDQAPAPPAPHPRRREPHR